MKQDMVYDVAVADTSKELVAIVNRALAQGWELVGGVSCSKAVDQGRYEYLFSQAVIRPRTISDTL
jgi:hypothetical protein